MFKKHTDTNEKCLRHVGADMAVSGMKMPQNDQLLLFLSRNMTRGLTPCHDFVQRHFPLRYLLMPIASDSSHPIGVAHQMP